MRNQMEIHLNQAGVDLARRVGDTMSQSDLVVSSSLDRAMETAIAMGFAVDIISDELATVGDEVMEEVGQWDIGFQKIRELLDKKGHLFNFVNIQISYLKSIFSKLTDGQVGLLISHGGIVDYPLVALFPDEDHSRWGNPFSYCEGYRISFDSGKFVGYQLLRVE
jgi:hypothetical protein